MRSGVAAVQNTLTPPAQNVLRHAIHNAQGRGHMHVQPLHVALVLLSHGGPLLRQACADLHTQALHGLQQCHALELCFNVALDRLPQSSSNNTHPLALSNALVAALKRAQTHQKRGCPEQQQPPLVAVKVEIEQLIISILEDPSVSRVMKEAGFVSQDVKTNLENAISQKPSVLDLEPPLVGCVGARPPMPPLPSTTSESTEDQKLLCCPECTSHFNAECKQLQAQESAQAEAVVPSLPSWLQKEKDIKSEQEKGHLFSQKLLDLQRKWQLFCKTSHSGRDVTLDLLPPHNWLDANIPKKTTTLGLMAANSTPQQSVEFTSLPTPTPLTCPQWTRSLPSIAPLEAPRSLHNDSMGTKSQGLQNVDKQATLVSEDSGERIDRGLRPIEQGRSQPNPSPLSRLHANLPKSLTSGCPLRSPLSGLKASKPLSKPLAQKLPSRSMSPLSQPLDTSLGNDKLPPVFFDQKAAERLKHVYKGLLEKVSWQSNAISKITTALVNAQSGMGKRQGLNIARADTCLLLLGPDQVGKRLVADALAELVLGTGKKPVCFGLLQQDKDSAFSRWGRKDQQQRGRTTLDSVADVLRTNPLCLLLLEDIDQADSVLRMNLARAMETGKFLDSSARQVNMGNAVVIMTSKVGTVTDSISGIGKESLFREEKLAFLNGARMTVRLSPPVDEEEVVLRGENHKIIVVKDPVAENPVTLLSPGKRKSSGFLKQALSMHKRPKVVPPPTGRTIPLDLNLSAEENDEAGACCQEESEESKTCDPVLDAAQEALSPSFVNLVDTAVVFEPFDMMKQAKWILSQLSVACSGLIAEVCTRVEVDFQLLEHMVGITWRSGNRAFETWLQEKLKTSLNAFTAQAGMVGENRVLRLVYEDSFSKELCSASELPLQIEVGSR